MKKNVKGLRKINQESVRIIYKYRPLMQPVALWKTLCNILKNDNLISEKYKHVDTVKTTIQIEEDLSKRALFIIEDKMFSFSFSMPFSGKLQQLIINKEKKVKIDWDVWIKELSLDSKFVYAWRYDREYVHWQNDRQISSYQIHCKPYEHLPLKLSGDSFPLPQLIIDTSKNPGRNIFKAGYVEAVGSTMWLGEPFFFLTGIDKEVVKASDWLNATELSPEVLKIKIQDDCFTQSSGKEAELQNKLRTLLYPNAS